MIEGTASGRPDGDSQGHPQDRRAHRGVQILHDPRLNKGTAFTDEEREVLGLRGLLPPRIFTQDEQEHRVLANLRRLDSALDKYLFLVALLDRNERLFYRTVVDNLVRDCCPSSTRRRWGRHAGNSVSFFDGRGGCTYLRRTVVASAPSSGTGPSAGWE